MCCHVLSEVLETLGFVEMGGELAYFSLPLPLTTVRILRLFLWIVHLSEGDQQGQNQERTSNGLCAGIMHQPFTEARKYLFFSSKHLSAI